MGASSQSELRLATLVDERELFHGKHEEKLAEIATREDKNATHADKELLRGYREKLEDFDTEIAEMTQEIERSNTAIEQSKQIRRLLTTDQNGVQVDGDGVVYRTMAAYARDVILTGSGNESAKIQQQLGNKTEVQAARERLQMIKRIDDTLSADVGGLQPPQHIEQIFQVITTARPIVASASPATLERGVLTFPQVDARPEVAVQTSEKVQAGDNKMEVSMQKANATVYQGGGDLSWQAINWSTPDALDLWFRLAADAYALLTEQDAGQVLVDSAFTAGTVSDSLDATPSFAEFMTAVGEGYAEVFLNSGRIANTIYLAPDRFGYLLGLTSDAFAQFVTVNGDSAGPLQFIVSRGLSSGVIMVGDRSALLVAETAGAPVELRVVEPAIGGVEVGIIGAFEAVVVDPGAFALLTDAS